MTLYNENSNYDDKVIAGVDEVGRGPLAGAVVAAAVILNLQAPVAGLMDSKKLSEKKRELLADEIKDKALCWCVARAEVEEIDRINILQASLLAMRRAVMGLSVAPEQVLVDGNRCPQLDYPVKAIVKGDALVPAISAASILAKVVRDREMIELDKVYPGYGLAGHKGYPTAAHIKALKELGPTDIHRRSFGPVKKLLGEPEQFSII